MKATTVESNNAMEINAPTMNELSRLPDDYVTIDESEKSFLLSVATGKWEKEHRSLQENQNRLSIR